MPILDISCQHVWKALSDYIEGEVDADLRRRMEEHFKACAHCTAVLDGTRNLIRLVGDGRAFELPTGFSDRLRKRLTEHLAKSGG